MDGIIAGKREAGGQGDQGIGRQKEGVRRRGGMERRSCGKHGRASDAGI